MEDLLFCRWCQNVHRRKKPIIWDTLHGYHVMLVKQYRIMTWHSAVQVLQGLLYVCKYLFPVDGEEFAVFI